MNKRREMSEEEKFESWFRPQDPEPTIYNREGHTRSHREWTTRFFSAKLAWLECSRRDEASRQEMKDRITRLEEAIEKVEEHLDCISHCINSDNNPCDKCKWEVEQALRIIKNTGKEGGSEVELKYELSRKIEKLQIWCAWRLPRWLVKWAIIRLMAHATTGKYGSTIVPELTIAEALKRWAK